MCSHVVIANLTVCNDKPLHEDDMWTKWKEETFTTKVQQEWSEVKCMLGQPLGWSGEQLKEIVGGK